MADFVISTSKAALIQKQEDMDWLQAQLQLKKPTLRPPALPLKKQLLYWPTACDKVSGVVLSDSNHVIKGTTVS